MHPGVLSGKTPQQFQRAVLRAVVYKEDLKGYAAGGGHLIHHPLDLPPEIGQRRLLIVAGHND